MSSKNGRIDATIAKELDLHNCGRFTLPLRPIHNSELTPTGSLAETNLLPKNLMSVMFSISGSDQMLQDVEQRTGQPRTDPFFSLRMRILSFWLSNSGCPEVTTLN